MRKEKPLFLNEIKEKIDQSKAMIVTSYDKLEPNTSWLLRELLAGSKDQFEVVKKRLFLKAAESSGIKLDGSLLKGHIGVVFVSHDDLVASVKKVFKFSESNQNLLQMIFASEEGKITPGSELEILAKLPGLDEMRATLLALFVSPMSQLLSVFEAVMANPLSTNEKKSES